MDLFTLAAKLQLDSSSFERGIRKAEQGGKSFGSRMENTFNKVAKAAKVVFSAVAIKKTIDLVASFAGEVSAAGDKIDKQSQALGMSRKAYQEWDYILSQTGGSIDSLGVSMKTLNTAILSGGKETNDALKQIGLSAKDLKGLSQEDAFEKVVRAFQKMPAGAEKSAAAIKLFGRNGMELLPLLNSDIYSIDILRAKAEELGLVMSDEAVDAFAEYTDALDTMQRTFNGLKYSIGAKVLPTLTAAMEKITRYASKIRKAYEKEGLSGVFKTIWQDIKNIPWPSWEDVKSAAIKAWNGIKRGAAAIAREVGLLVFGSDDKGEVKWPTWDDVKNAAVKAWEWIKRGAASIMREAGVLIFGADDKGEVKWPTWEEVKDFAIQKWEEIKKKAAELTGLVFGSPQDVVDGLGKLLGDLTEKVSEIGWESVGKYIYDHTIGALLKLPGKILSLFRGGANEVKAINWSKLGESIVNWILSAFQNFGELLVGYFKSAWDESVAFWSPIVDWVKNNIFAPIGNFVDEYITQPIMRVLDEVKQKIQTAGEWLGLDIFGMKAERINKGKEFAKEAVAAGYKGAAVGEYLRSQFGSTAEVEKAIELLEKMDEEREKNKREGHDGISAKTMEAVYEAIGRVVTSSEKANEGITTVKEAAAEAAGTYDITFNVTTNGSFPAVPNKTEMRRRWKPKAKGDWSVPYDDYPALLHRGERVLTASQARHQDNGGSREIVAAIQSLRNDMQHLKLVVGAKTFGKAVVDYSGRRMDGYIGKAEDTLAAGYGS